MNNEPVAWIGETLMGRQYINGQKDELPVGTALYTHPVKELDEQFKKGFEAGKEEGWKAHKFHHPVKELGYNDIMGTWWETMPNAKSCEGVFEFAKEILRKASEK